MSNKPPGEIPIPIEGCPGCQTTGGVYACRVHSPNPLVSDANYAQAFKNGWDTGRHELLEYIRDTGRRYSDKDEGGTGTYCILEIEEWEALCDKLGVNHESQNIEDA